jgi:protein-L-isoaspartate(D-aspartate) O-methyltransferase
VDVRRGDASTVADAPFDGMLINAGVTHPLDCWLDALARGGRMMLPVTAGIPAMGATLGKGVVALLTRGADDRFAARVVGLVAIYSAVGVRDDSLNERIGQALMGGPAQWQNVAALRRDRHEPLATCWLHTPASCFSTVQVS